MTEDGKQFSFSEPNDELKQPSDAYIQDIFGERGGTRNTEPPDILEIHYWLERTANWVRTHGTPTEIPFEELMDRWRDELDASMPFPVLSAGAQGIYDRYEPLRIGSDTWTLEGHKAFWDEMEQRVRSKDLLWYEFHNILDVEQNRKHQVHHWAWEREHLLNWSWVLFRVSEDPPDWALKNLGLDDAAPAPATFVSGDANIALRLTRPTIAAGFRYDGREGLGRTSSSQISQAVFSMCIAPKDAWSKTSKGFPLYIHTVPTGQIDLTLRPEIESKDPMQLATQVKDMEKIRDEISIDDWDMACILMEQSLTENGGQGRAYISDADACDYRKLEKNRKDGFAAGHHPDNRKRASDSINRLVHLWVRTDTLHINEVDGKGKLRSVPVNWREKYITIRETLERQDTEIAIAWYYEFGRSFTTFLQRPNNYIAYLLQGTIALKGTQESAKKVAHYVALRLRVDAHNGAVYDLAMGKLVEATHLPYDETRAKRTIDLNEDTMRTCVREGLFRIKARNGDILHSGSAATVLKAWTLRDSNLRGKEMLKHWKRQKVLILAEPDIERRYDHYRRISHTSKPASST